MEAARQFKILPLSVYNKLTAIHREQVRNGGDHGHPAPFDRAPDWSASNNRSGEDEMDEEGEDRFNVQTFLQILPKPIRRKARIVLSHIRASIIIDQNHYVGYKDFADQEGSSLIELLEFFLSYGIMSKHTARPADALTFFMVMQKHRVPPSIINKKLFKQFSLLQRRYQRDFDTAAGSSSSSRTTGGGGRSGRQASASSSAGGGGASSFRWLTR